MPAAVQAGAFLQGYSYDLIWATNEWPLLQRPWLDVRQDELASLAEEAVVAFVEAATGYPLSFRERRLFRVRVRDVQSATRSIQDVLRDGNELLDRVVGVSPQETFVDPQTGEVFPAPVVFVYAPDERLPEEKGPNWPAVAVAGGLTGLLLWIAYRQLGTGGA